MNPAKQSLDEARRTLELFRQAELQAIPGHAGKTSYEIFAKENGMMLVSQAVARVVAARRIVANYDAKKAAR